jgi:CubicO group peptidase (beta-lactamase class C family)
MFDTLGPDMPNRICFSVATAALCLGVNAQEPAPPAAYWPDRHWRTATPESQGLDSQVLTSAVDQILQKHLGVHSMLVIRHGYAVLDSYFYPYNSGTPHDLASVTKSITSTLTGIAVAHSIIKTDQPVLSFFPQETPANPDEQKRRITVGNLLRMESGLDCGYAPGEQELEQMKRSANWVQFALGLPMKYDPGTHSSYCSPGYHLLGSAIASAAHQSEVDFGRKYLFGPLGIRDVVWAPDPQGRSHGWGDNHLYPEDVAKVGYLYLHGGQWNGKQIVPREWVEMSTAPPTGERGGPGGLGYEWGGANGPNGRQFGGTGRGGQSLVVWPDLDMVVVITGGGNTGQMAAAVRQSVKSAEPLPAQPEAYRGLQAKVAEAAKAPAAAAVPELPAMAASISGKRYTFPLNSSRLDSLSLTFRDQNEARLDVKYLGEDLTFPVGLDGVYRLGPNGPLHLLAGAQGKWTSENEFLLDLNFIANINHYTLKIHFESDRIEVTADEASGLIRNGHITGR